MKNKDKFKPYISSDKKASEITVTSVIMGIILAVIFGAANAYLGLRVGMTVSASIPAAVASMGIIRIIMRKNSILESNIVQTVGSAGESLAAGAIFTLPALFLWASEGKIDKPSIPEITLITLFGGLLGIFFMVPLRNALIVKEHETLPYPEGKACAEVLLAGETGGSNASTVFWGMGFSALFKFIIDGLKVVSGQISFRIKGFAGEIGTQIYPAVMSVGYICGPKISSYMFAGSVLSWLVIIPIIALFGENAVIYPETVPVLQILKNGGASAVWSSYIRYIGAGALAAGGIISLIKSLPLIVQTFWGAIKGAAEMQDKDNERTSRNLSIRTVIISIIFITFFVWLIPTIPVNLTGAVIIVIFGFFFAAVSARMAGLVGSSNNPVSGMSIATLLIASLILKFTGSSGMAGMCSAIAIGSIICIISAVSGDTSQDLKTGYLLGATPKKQQIGEIIGVIASSLAIGGTLYLLDSAWGFGTDELSAPQATLMKMIIEGVMEGKLPWALVFIGVFIAVTAEITGVPVLPFAIGVYLPIHLNACIMTGGLVRLLLDKIKKTEEDKKSVASGGILFCSGMIAGEGLTGIILALLSVFGISKAFDFSENISPVISDIGGIVLFAIIIMTLIAFSLRQKKSK